MAKIAKMKMPEENRSYSAQAAMELLKIGPEGLKRLEAGGRLRLHNIDGTVPGYPAEQVEALLINNRGGDHGQTR